MKKSIQKKGGTANKNVRKHMSAAAIQTKAVKEEKKENKNEEKTGIRPLGDRVLIREIEAEEKETRTASGIIIPSSESGDKGSKKGEVIAVGPGKHEDGNIIPVSVKAGDKVLFQWGDKLVSEDITDNTDYYIVRESEILAIIK